MFAGGREENASWFILEKNGILKICHIFFPCVLLSKFGTTWLSERRNRVILVYLSKL